ncbi:hypothetical protein UFOVP27_33 [uncultured Caudovirales phage]|uniref:Uncharacterized protein n=1 Tax=uncultured Caudovirales phage TaxID=2100421 RepID=A0A6J5KJZ5_9CAUD|nr:hypothetical protein UFOVP27_33 [uncultured Caudovirales phage]
MSEETTITSDASSPEETPKFKTGYLVLVSDDGNVFVEKDTTQLPISVEREATLLEVRRYTSEILMDLQAQAAAEYTSLRLKADASAEAQQA